MSMFGMTWHTPFKKIEKGKIDDLNFLIGKYLVHRHNSVTIMHP